MLKLPGRVALVIGASQGIGASTASALARAGYRVYGASRSIEPGPGPQHHGVKVDVTDDASVNAAIAEVVAHAGQLDVVVNCAGYSIAGSVEELSLAEVHGQLDTNFFGVVRVCKAVLPHLRERGGIIINVGSLASAVPLPYQAYYSASKAALAAFSEAFGLEASSDGIRVVLIEPGDIKTTFTQNRRRATTVLPRTAQSFQRVLEVVERDERGAIAPTHVADVVMRALRAGGTKPRYRVGMLSQRAAVGIAALMPRRIFHMLLRKYYRV